MTIHCRNCQELQQELLRVAKEYWGAAEECEDGAPDQLPMKERLIDFALYLQEATR